MSGERTADSLKPEIIGGACITRFPGCSSRCNGEYVSNCPSTRQERKDLASKRYAIRF